MDVQWYPGHMTKTVRQMQEDVRLVDIVIEILDARVPVSSRNPDIDRIAAGKSRLVLLNKADLADEAQNRAWQTRFERELGGAMLLDARKRIDKKKLIGMIQEACAEKIARDRAKGMKERPIRAMVCGIPNVGKSTFINSFAGRAIAKTGNKPGVTRGKQWIRLDAKIELLDTPGLLWPKFEDRTVGENLALIGSINDQILPQDELAMLLITRLRKTYPGVIGDRFGIDEHAENVIPLAGQSEESARALGVLEAVGQKRGCLVKGGGIDYGRASAIMLDEFRSGNLGRITLENTDM
ncbi:MAG: ribosome biogenesis GTPase YlqF [Lachnospiraceae bacterium]|nr:ribosome biogenesis GTPase YlqF [Lachnospiraceae bacterium]